MGNTRVLTERDECDWQAESAEANVAKLQVRSKFAANTQNPNTHRTLCLEYENKVGFPFDIARESNEFCPVYVLSNFSVFTSKKIRVS